MKNLSPSIQSIPFIILDTCIRSALSLLYSSVGKPNFLKRSG